MTIPTAPPRQRLDGWLRRGVAFSLASVVIVVGSYVVSGVRLAGRPDAAAGGLAVPSVPSLDVSSASTGPGGLVPPAQRVTFWEQRVSAAGTSPSYLDLIYLADAYLDRSRASGDLGDLTRSQTALGRAEVITPDPKGVQIRQALVAFSLHEWQRAEELADELLGADPSNVAALGLSGDVYLETGRVDEARQRFATLDGLVASPAVWSRLGRLAFLTGDPATAIRLVSRAAASALDEGVADAVAFYRFQLAELYRQTAQLDKASRAYRGALDALPSYLPASVGLARTLEARGDRPAAISLLEKAVARLPQPETVAMLGDLYTLNGDMQRADRTYALVDRIGQVARATGSVYDRQLTLFDADHDRDLPDALTRARAELVVRPDVYGYDALAWALFKSGDLEAAAAAAAEAMTLGTPDPRIVYHAGMIAAAQGRADDARRLLTAAIAGSAMLPPLQVPVAEAALAALGAVSAR
jgi:tetratricopeptide (TPR) repeat protein